MNLKQQYIKLKSNIFNLVYYDMSEYIKENWESVSDWTGLSTEIYDYREEKRYKFGEKVNFPLPQLNEHYNKGRILAETVELEFGKESGMLEVAVINGDRIHIIEEDAIAEITGCIQKQIEG